MTATLTGGARSTKGGRGTMQYKAPEHFADDDNDSDSEDETKASPKVTYDKPADVYSFGMMCWEIFSGKVPFASKNDGKIVAAHIRAINGGKVKRPSLDGIPSEIVSFIEACWAQDFTIRPTFKKAKELLNAVGTVAIHGALNVPGYWDVIIGHSRRCAAAVTLATEAAAWFEKRGMTVWLDVRMNDRSTAAMEEGVKHSTVFVAVVTGPCVNNDAPNDPQEGNAYFRRPYCIKELRWAQETGKFIQPILRIEDKSSIGKFLNLLDEPLKVDGKMQNISDLKCLGRTDWIDLNRNDNDYWDVGMKKLCRALKTGEKKATSSRSQSSLTSSDSETKSLTPTESSAIDFSTMVTIEKEIEERLKKEQIEKINVMRASMIKEEEKRLRTTLRTVSDSLEQQYATKIEVAEKEAAVKIEVAEKEAAVAKERAATLERNEIQRKKVAKEQEECLRQEAIDGAKNKVEQANKDLQQIAQEAIDKKKTVIAWKERNVVAPTKPTATALSNEKKTINTETSKKKETEEKKTQKEKKNISANTADTEFRNIDTNVQDVIQCDYSEKDASMGLEFGFLQGGGCLTVSVVEGSISHQAGVTPGMSLTTAFTTYNYGRSLFNRGHRSFRGHDVTKMSFLSIHDLLKQRPLKTHWKKLSQDEIEKASSAIIHDILDRDGFEYGTIVKADTTKNVGTTSTSPNNSSSGETKTNSSTGTMSTSPNNSSSGETKTSSSTATCTTVVQSIAQSIDNIDEDNNRYLEEKIYTETYSSGDHYCGQKKGGKKHGQGTLTSTTGAVYTGGWEDNEFHGQGTITYASGNTFVGIFKKGQKYLFQSANSDSRSLSTYESSSSYRFSFQGYLQKQSSWMKQWRRRWCVLQGKQLQFSKTKEALPHRTIDLKKCLTITLADVCP